MFVSRRDYVFRPQQLKAALFGVFLRHVRITGKKYKGEGNVK